MLIEPYQTVSAYVNDSIFNSMRRSWPKTAESRGYLKSDVVERVSHISNEQERDALAALEILKERFGEEEWSLKAVAWTVANCVDQTWDDTPVKVAVRGFLDWKKEGAQEQLS